MSNIEMFLAFILGIIIIFGDIFLDSKIDSLIEKNKFNRCLNKHISKNDCKYIL